MKNTWINTGKVSLFPPPLRALCLPHPPAECIYKPVMLLGCPNVPSNHSHYPLLVEQQTNLVEFETQNLHHLLRSLKVVALSSQNLHKSLAMAFHTNLNFLCMNPLGMYQIVDLVG